MQKCFPGSPHALCSARLRRLDLNVTRFLAAAICFAATCAMLGNEAGAQNTATITVDEYKEFILQQRAKIESMSVSYELEITSDPQVETRGRLAGLTLKQKDTVAFLGDKRFRSTISTGFGSGKTPVATERTAVFDGEDCRLREAKTFKIQKEKSGYTELNLYANGLLWPSTDAEIESCRQNPSDSLFLPYFLDKDSWSVSPTLEEVGGVLCTVIGKNDSSRTLWLDREKGYALVRYEQLNPVPGESKWTFVYSAWEEDVPGIFFPRHIVGTHVIVEDRTSERIGELTSTLTVSALQANDVSESLFTMDPQPGELVIDSVNRTITHFNPHDDDTLERSIATASGQMLQNDRGAGRFALVFGVCLVPILVAVWLGRRYARKHSV